MKAQNAKVDAAAVVNNLARQIEETSREKGFLRATWDTVSLTDATKTEYYISFLGRRILELARAADYLRSGDEAGAATALWEAQTSLEGLELTDIHRGTILAGNEVNDIKLALVVTELDELSDALHKDDKANAAEEVADAIIRLLDIGASLGLDVGAALVAKVEKNKERPSQHGKVSAA